MLNWTLEDSHTLFDAIRQLMRPDEKGRKAIGFKVEEEGAAYCDSSLAHLGRKKGAVSILAEEKVAPS